MDNYNLSPTELEIARINLGSVAVDPFGLSNYANQVQIWKQAAEVDSVFVRKISFTDPATFGMFYCKDCDAFVKCSAKNHDAYIRCLGKAADHCAVCV